MESKKIQTLVIGAGPGGYTAAFRAADLGQQVILVERYSELGGVCLNVGCIPSKALLHVAKLIDETKNLSKYGITSNIDQNVDLKVLRDHVLSSTVTKLTGGLKALAKQRKVEVVNGVAKFISPNSVIVKSETTEIQIDFEYIILAVGSRPIKLPFLPNDPRIMDSTGALELHDLPKELLIIGGGIIGIEMGTVYAALGSNVTVVELAPNLLGNVDTDLVAPLQKRMQSKFKAILLETKVTAVTAEADGLTVTFEGKNAPTAPQKFDKILQCVGRVPNSDLLDLEKAGLVASQQGFIEVDKAMRTKVNHIFAIGDVVGQPMLAHKAIPEGKVAAEVISGKKHVFDPKCIASVAYTDPEVSWVGVTERDAKQQSIEYEKAVFPWVASGRALAEGRSEGFTKLLFDKHDRVIGAGIVGLHAGDLISEMALAIEMGCDVEDIALTIHPHPTLAESMALAAEIHEGSITDLYMPKKK